MITTIIQNPNKIQISQFIIMIIDVVQGLNVNHKVNYELREWHELHRNNVSVIREIRSHKS